jgi:hypothetical protein
VFAVKSAIITAGFILVCVLLVAQGALQCLAPRKLNDVQDMLRLKGDYSSSAWGASFEKWREKQANQPCPLYRFSGLMLMGAGVLMLLMDVFGFFRR